MTIILTFIKKILKRRPRGPSSIEAKYIIPRTKHNISKTDISDNALKVLNRLNSAGYEAYLVGGGVRDLLVRKAPKDFDIATSATPNQVKKLFRNGRIIGRRFKLVHILFYRDVIEVATFRGSQADDEQQIVNEKGMLVRDNVYGTAFDDAWRRDFTINSLFYDIKNASIIDLTGGFKDIQAKQVRIIGDPQVRYQEDPVRMLRAIRFAAKLHFSIAPDTAKPLHSMSELITHVSPSRLFDEITKLYQCGEAKVAHQLMQETGMFARLFPLLSDIDRNEYPLAPFISNALESTDRRMQEAKPVNPAFLFAVFLWFPLLQKQAALITDGVDPLPALEQAMGFVLSSQCKLISIPKRFTQVIREIWLLQYRFTKRHAKKPFQLLSHARFRAAYDFMALRALAGNEAMELADWWTRFQDVDAAEQQNMLQSLDGEDAPKRKRRRKCRKKPADSVESSPKE